MRKHLIIRKGERIRFKCIRSGTCCTSGPNVSLTSFDLCRISRYLKKPWRELVGRYVNIIIADYYPVITLKSIGLNVCVFLEYSEVDGTYIPSCSIYPARPMRCRLFPFIPVSPGNSNAVYVSTICPGVGKGSEVEPPWSTLEQYLSEVRRHYELLHELIFDKGYEPEKAIEEILDRVCGLQENTLYKTRI